MKRENLFLLLNSLILLVIGLLIVVIYTNLAITTKADKIFNTKVKIEEVSNKPATFNSINEVNKGGHKIGTLFDVTKTNEYGEINLIVGIDTNDVIVGFYQNVDQGFPVLEDLERLPYEEHVYLYVESLVGSSVHNPEISDDNKLDGEGKPTLVFTVGTIDEILDDIAKYLKPEVEIPEPVDVVKFIETVEGGRKYLASKKSVNVGRNEALLEVEMVIDANNKLISYNFITYEHTLEYGDLNFRAVVDAFLDSMIDNDINDPTAGLNKTGDLYDGQAGVTNSTNAVLDLLNELAQFIGEEN